MTLLFDVPTVAGPVGIAAAVGFFLTFVAVAYIAFRVLRRTMRMAFRLTIVALILLIAIIGTIAIFWAGSSGGRGRPPRPVPTRTR